MKGIDITYFDPPNWQADAVKWWNEHIAGKGGFHSHDFTSTSSSMQKLHVEPFSLL